MERNKDDEAAKTCGDHLEKKLLAEKIGRTNKPLIIKVKQSVKDRCVKIKSNDEQYTEIHHKKDVSSKINLNITDTANQKESVPPERWLTLNAAIHTYTNTEHNGASSLFVNIERTPKRDSVTFWRPVDKLTNEQLLDLCHGALNKTNSSISLNQFKNLNDVSMNISLSTSSGNNLSDQNKFESENEKTTPVQNESTASNYSETIEKKSDITFEQVQVIQEEKCRRKKLHLK
ncbi:unnamed protein product [Mytilus edulis]|uniref:Uncharacterized protein n=1 Tax=Mytilus edulis TaxID=6550 RepID=A0A8S3Q2H0_MYTED|nr:unnamed protein product [Mytilus edulis]